MDNRKLIIICIAVIAIVACIVCASIFIGTAKETQVGIDFNEINQGDNLTINLTDENGQPLADQVVKITINNQTYNRTTDNTGKTQIAINLEPGDYEITVKYDGKLFKYKSSEFTTALKVLDKSTQSMETFPYYSPSIGHYKHISNNGFDLGLVKNEKGEYFVLAGDGFHRYNGVDMESSLNGPSFVGK